MAGAAGYELFGDQLGIRHAIEVGSSQRNGNVSLAINGAIIEVWKTKLDLEITNNGTSPVRFDQGDAVLLQDGERLGSLGCSGLFGPCRDGMAATISGGRGG